MKRYWTKFLKFGLMLALAGCSTTPTSSSTANLVPSQVYAVADSRTVEVAILRDAGFMGSACVVKVYIEGKYAASLGAGERTILHVPPGEVILGVDPGLCAGAYVEASANVEAGQPLYFRISRDHNGSIAFHRTVPR